MSSACTCFMIEFVIAIKTDKIYICSISRYEKFVIEMKENAPRTLEEGTRDHYITKGDGKSKQRQVLSENKCSALQ